MENPVAIYFCGVFIHWHGILLACAALLTALCAALLHKAKGRPARDVWLVALIGFVPAMLIGRAFYCHFMQESFTDKAQMMDISSGGTALYGVAAGYILTIVGYCLLRRQSITEMLDTAAPAAALGIFVGRIASYFSGDDIGRAVTDERFQKLPTAVYSAATGEWNLAVFSFEAITALIIFVLLMVVLVIGDAGWLKLRSGDIALLFALLYGIPQTVYESMRGDSLFLISLGFVRISQIISILAATAAFVIFSVRSGKKGMSPWHYAVWGVCLACIALAFWMEFCMTSTTAVRNYTIMSLCLAVYMFSGLAFWLDSSEPEKDRQPEEGGAEPEDTESASEENDESEVCCDAPEAAIAEETITAE